MADICKLLGHLRELRLDLEDFNLDDPQDGVRSEGNVDVFMGAASQNVRTLNLQFPHKWEPEDGSATPVGYVLRACTWPRLRDFTIANASVDITFAEFLIQHVPQLERLSMKRLHLTEGSWESIFKELGGQMSRLKVASLWDYFSNEDYEEVEIDFADDSLGHLRSAMEKFIVEGGDCPDLEPARIAQQIDRARFAEGLNTNMEAEGLADDIDSGDSDDSEVFGG